LRDFRVLREVESDPGSQLSGLLSRDQLLAEPLDLTPRILAGMGIVLIPRNDVPVDVRLGVPVAGEVHLDRLKG
jgi:hypothetical protein